MIVGVPRPVLADGPLLDCYLRRPDVGYKGIRTRRHRGSASSHPSCSCVIQVEHLNSPHAHGSPWLSGWQCIRILVLWFIQRAAVGERCRALPLGLRLHLFLLVIAAQRLFVDVMDAGPLALLVAADISGQHAATVRVNLQGHDHLGVVVLWEVSDQLHAVFLLALGEHMIVLGGLWDVLLAQLHQSVDTRLEKGISL